MPQIPLIFGKMDLESDQTSKRDSVLATLYNGFRVGQSIHMWPSLAEYCDLGTGKPAWNWYSTLHNVHLAVSGGKLYVITADGHTEITHTSLVDGTPPSFAEDAHRIFAAAGADINFWTPGAPRVFIPRHGDIPPVVSAVTTATTLKPDLGIVYCGFKAVGSDVYIIRYKTHSAIGKHYRVDVVTNGNAVTKVNDEAPGEHTVSVTSVPTGTYIVQLRLADVTTGDILAESGPLSATLTPGNGTPIFVQVDGTGTEPAITVSELTETGVTFNYGTHDSESDKYDLYLSLDGGGTYTKVKESESQGGNYKYRASGLSPNTHYRALLSMVALTGCKSQVVSPLIEFDTLEDHSVSADDNDPDSPLTFSAQPVVASAAIDAVTVHYGTADSDGNTYKVEYSINGGVTWSTASSLEKPGSGKEISIDQLTPDTAYTVLVRLTSNPAQCPVNVTSLAYLSGFLVAVGDDYAGGSVPGDFAFSDTQGEDGIPTYEKWDFENNATKPDALQAIIATTDGNLYGIGTETVDVSYISGSVDNPFAANTSAGQPFGTPAKHSAAYDSESGYFLAVIQGTRQVVKLVGGRVAQVVSFPVSVPIQDVRDITTARAMMVSYRACPFYIITFPNADVQIEDSFHESLTLAYNIRMEEWSIFGDWNTGTGQYDEFRALSFAYNQSVGYLGGSDGKIYTLAQEPRTEEPVFIHRWRNDGNLEWRGGREISLGVIGDRKGPLKQRQCGRYYRRQDEFIFANADMRMCIRTGWRNWGKNAEKISKEYVYDVKRGDSGVVFNGVDEEITVL